MNGAGHLKRRSWSPIALAFSFRTLIKSCSRGVKPGERRVIGRRWVAADGGGWRVVACARDLQVACVKLVDRVECSGANQRQPPQRVHAREKIFHLACEM